MRFAARVDHLGGGSVRAWDIHNAGKEALARGENVIVLSVGDPDFATTQAITDAGGSTAVLKVGTAVALLPEGALLAAAARLALTLVENLSMLRRSRREALAASVRRSSLDRCVRPRSWPPAAPC